MNKKQNILKTNKVLAIESGDKLQFISEVEEEKVSGFRLKYYMWLSRLFILFAIISLTFFALFSLSLFKLAPQITVEPFLIINQDKSDGIVRYEPISTDMASQNQLMETFVKQYVILRNTIIDDMPEMRSRWFPGGMVHFLSAPDVFRPFETSVTANWQGIFDSKLVREVEIISISKLGGERSPVWKVDFKTYDLSEASRDSGTRGLNLKVRYWTASVTSYFIPQRKFLGLRLINPLGFTVTRYSQTEVEIY